MVSNDLQENKETDFDDSIDKMDHDSARHQWISVSAYYKAQARGFVPGLELDDWLAAEKDYIEMLISTYLSILEEDGVMTIVGLQQLAKSIGARNPERMNLKVDLIRAIQDASRTRPCYQIDPGNLCCDITDCLWKTECRKMIAIWKL
jgi:hypothetical protein